MKQFRLVVVASVFLFLVTVPAAHAALLDYEKLTLSGFLKNATSINVSSADKMDQFLKIRSTAQLELEYQFTDNIHFFTILRGWYDSVYDAESRWRKGENRKEHFY